MGMTFLCVIFTCSFRPTLSLEKPDGQQENLHALHITLGRFNVQVPNIRFNVAKMLQRLLSLVEPHVIEQQIKPCLQQLTEDSDVDVTYYAKAALAAC